MRALGGKGRGTQSRRMLEHYSRIRMDAKHRALDAIAQPLEQGVFGVGVNQIGNQLEVAEAKPAAKLLNWMVRPG